MADVFPKSKRSEIMSRVRSRENAATELAFVMLLRRYHIAGWRRGARVFGHPDFVFPKQRLTVFVDGCFWHGCPQHATQPASNRTFWKRKLARNRRRDRLVSRTLKNSGWRVLRVWQHDLLRKNEQNLLRRLRRAMEAPKKNAAPNADPRRVPEFWADFCTPPS